MKVNELGLRVKYRIAQFSELELIDALKVVIAILIYFAFFLLGFFGVSGIRLLVVLLFLGLIYFEIKKTFKIITGFISVALLLWIPFAAKGDELASLFFGATMTVALFSGIPYLLINSAAKNFRVQIKNKPS